MRSVIIKDLSCYGKKIYNFTYYKNEFDFGIFFTI